jgi:hypothetical protein
MGVAMVSASSHSSQERRLDRDASGSRRDASLDVVSKRRTATHW